MQSSHSAASRSATRGVVCAVLAAALYALNSPFSKLLLTSVQPAMMAALLYLGAGFGMLFTGFARKTLGRQSAQRRLQRGDLPYVLGMIVLDIAAPIFLMLGLSSATAANVSLLNNFEIVATSLIALWLFGERISKRLWIGIALVTLASVLLSVEGAGSFAFSSGSLFVLLACVCWGFENNCTRKLSVADPLEIVVIKGVFSGLGSLVVALCVGEAFAPLAQALAALLLGFVAYGLSIFFYVKAQRVLGAAKTSSYYAIAPFVGAGLSFLVFQEPPNRLFLLAMAVMLIGTVFVSRDE